MNRDIIVIGASAGGVEAVPRLLGSLGAETPAAFFVTMHVSANQESIMPRLITRGGKLPAQHAKDGTPIKRGHIYVAPPDYHMLIGQEVVRLSHGPRENRHRPAIDPLFRSAAQVYGPRVIGVLLTGNLDDGVAGLMEIQKSRGLTIVQDPAEADFPDMPRNALRVFHPDYCLRLHAIQDLLASFPHTTSGGAKVKTKRSTKKKNEPAEEPGVEPQGGRPVPFVCPECNGPLWEVRNGKLLRYQCLVGHRYTLESLLSAHQDELEGALWVALRALEERITLQNRLADEAEAAGRNHSMQMFQARLEENQKHARVLRGILEELGGKH